MTTQHTPGPWRIVLGESHDLEQCDLSIRGGGYILARMEGPNYDHDVANARLMTAAPDLLAALSSLLNCVDGQHDAEWLDRCKDRALIAITKATATTPG